MALSLQYNFPYIDADLVIRDAFERCGISNYLEDAVKYQSARRSLNFLLQHWPNRGFNLFTLEQGIIQIIPNQNVYELPLNTSKILRCRNASANRILGGVASSSAGGNAASCFTQNLTGPCTQTTPNGNISYLYPQPQPILYVGILSQVTAQYQISIDCAYQTAPAETDWINILNTPKVNYYTGQTLWYVLPYTNSAVNWRIRETGGATLNIAQISFDIPYISVPMESVGNDLYFDYVTNNQSGISNTYWVNRIRTPTLNVYPIPNGTTYQFFVFNRIRYIQDIGDFFNSLDVTATFMESATAGLAAKLAQKYAPDRYAALKAEAEQVYLEAGRENTENTTSQVTFGMQE
jgi:hypothetical protein